MKRFWITLSVLAVFAGLLYADDLPPASSGAAAPPLKTTKDKASYAIGLNIGKGLRSDGFSPDLNILLLGMQDGLAGGEPRLNKKELQAALVALQQEISEKKEEQRKVESAKNKQEGAAFLAANKSKPGIETLESGLQYKVLKSGTGKTPKATDTVRTHYRGTLIDGTVFDSSYDRGEPAVFPVNGVIRGWTEALQRMQVGDKWQLFLPSELAYGERGAGPDIGPNAVLIFEVELLGIEQ